MELVALPVVDYIFRLEMNSECFKQTFDGEFCCLCNEPLLLRQVVAEKLDLELNGLELRSHMITTG